MASRSDPLCFYDPYLVHPPRLPGAEGPERETPGHLSATQQAVPPPHPAWLWHSLAGPGPWLAEHPVPCHPWAVCAHPPTVPPCAGTIWVSSMSWVLRTASAWGPNEGRAGDGSAAGVLASCLWGERIGFCRAQWTRWPSPTITPCVGCDTAPLLCRITSVGCECVLCKTRPLSVPQATWEDPGAWSSGSSQLPCMWGSHMQGCHLEQPSSLGSP